jgi:high-affinity nickel permease
MLISILARKIFRFSFNQILHLIFYNYSNIKGCTVAVKYIISYIEENQILFDALSLSAGVYMVVIRNYELRFSHKIIIHEKF